MNPSESRILELHESGASGGADFLHERGRGRSCMNLHEPERGPLSPSRARARAAARLRGRTLIVGP